MRQFIPRIEMPAKNDVVSYLRKFSMQGHYGENWESRWADYILQWNQRRSEDHLVNGQPIPKGMEILYR